MIGDYLTYIPTYARSTKGIIGGKESGTYVSTYLGLRPDGVRPKIDEPPIGRAPVLVSKIGKRRKLLCLSTEPKCSPQALEALLLEIST